MMTEEARKAAIKAYATRRLIMIADLIKEIDTQQIVECVDKVKELCKAETGIELTNSSDIGIAEILVNYEVLDVVTGREAGDLDEVVEEYLDRMDDMDETLANINDIMTAMEDHSEEE